MAMQRQVKVPLRVKLYLTFLFLCLIGSACGDVQVNNGSNDVNDARAQVDGGNNYEANQYVPLRGNQNQQEQPVQNAQQDPNLTANPNPVQQNQAQINMGGQVQRVRQSIVDDPRCKHEVATYCNNMKGSILQVLACLQSEKLPEDAISEDCQHVIFTYKQKLTTDFRFDTAGQEVCKTALNSIPECQAEERGKGLVVPCLIEYLDDIADAACKKFLAKLEPIVFSNYRLIYKFAEACRGDIQALQCGRLEMDDEKGPFNHGGTVACLTDKKEKLSAACKHRIIRVAELQADDWTKDRQLFYACRNDRERLCGTMTAGNGQVYGCLYKHKFDQGMREKCRERLTARQKLQREDYKVNHRFASQCAADIFKHHCLGRSPPGINSRETFSTLSVVLLCLGAVQNNGSARLAPECRAEMMTVRRSLMEDFQLTPEIVSGCVEEIRECNGGTRPDKSTLHCLMDRVRGKNRGQPTIDRTSTECRRAIMVLLKEVNVRESVDANPVLQEACSRVINQKCIYVDDSDGKVIDCLMDFIDKPILKRDNPDCREKLMEIQYFVSRDFKLSVRFYRSCAMEMARVCTAGLAGQLGNQSAILICLYHASKADRISPECAKETKRVLMERAKDVDLDPEVEEVCRWDLMVFCSEKTEKNDEMDCLEDHLEDLDPDCKKLMERFIEVDEEEPELNEIFREECGPVIKEHCQKAADFGKDDENNSLMQCLIRNKNNDNVSNKCHAAVLHHQLVTMRDWKLSPDFKAACKETVERECPNRRSKADVVACLSGLVRNTTMLETKPKVPKPCRKQLTFELLQMSEDIELDPDLKRNCASDVEQYCAGVNHGRSQVIACLRKSQRRLSGSCRRMVFAREEAEARDPNTDYVLMTECKSMMKKYCIQSAEEMRSPAGMFRCLLVKKDDTDFDTDCAKVIVERQRMRAQDVRLNPELMEVCDKDIHGFCPRFMPTWVDQMDGKVLYCLRRRFAIHGSLRGARNSATDQRLTPACYVHVQQLIRESVLDYMQDTQLADACRVQIVDNCLSSTDNNEMSDRGEVIDCLRKQFEAAARNGSLRYNKACMGEVVRVMAEGKADVQVDAPLYAACANDILTSCKDIPRGEGRQMACLLDIHEAHPNHLRPECNKILTDRIQLWALAAQVSLPESLAEAGSLLLVSTANYFMNYFIAVGFALVGVVVIGGILFCKMCRGASKEPMKEERWGLESMGRSSVRYILIENCDAFPVKS